MTKIRLGILGMSKGNGHPYSWSAIFNGYRPSVMAECGFPSILAYLERQVFPRDFIRGARVTHIWTQDIALSHHISQAAYIDSIVERPEDMIGKVDGLLLARDDAENHLTLAKPFIKAGVPIYIDKPFALSFQSALDIFAIEVRAGQIFSCSALKYSPEMMLSSNEIACLGGITSISAQVPKSWEKYAIHVIDPILQNCGSINEISNITKRTFGDKNDGTELIFKFSGGANTCRIRAFGSDPSPILVDYSGPAGTIRTEFKDSFAAFKAALTVFLKDSVIGRKSYAQDIFNSIKLLELGNDKLKHQ